MTTRDARGNIGLCFMGRQGRRPIQQLLLVSFLQYMVEALIYGFGDQRPAAYNIILCTLQALSCL